MSNLFGELKRRNVFKVAVAYVIVGWVILQIADIIAPIMNLPETVSKYLLFLLIVLLPLVLFLAWVFDLKPTGGEGAAKDTAVKSAIPLVVSIILIGGLGYYTLLHEPSLVNEPSKITEGEKTPEINRASIAVLAFADLSQAGDQEYFGDGISESLLNVLAKVEELSVSSRTSSFAFKGKDRNVTDIANILNVAHVLEGSVKKAGNRVLITAQLIDAAENRHLWSDTYERELTTENIFAIQAEIANAIVEALSEELGIGLEKVAKVDPLTSNMSAYELYLQAKKVWEIQSVANAHRRVELLEKSVELDPSFVEGWADFAQSLNYLPSWDPEMDRAVYQNRAKEAAEKGLAIDPKNKMAYDSLIYAHFKLREFDKIYDLIQRARSNIKEYETLLNMTMGMGYLEDAYKQALEVSKANPDDAISYVIQALYFEANGQNKMAIELFEKSFLKGYTAGGFLLPEIQWSLGNTSFWLSDYNYGMVDWAPEFLPLVPHLYTLKKASKSDKAKAVARFKIIARQMGFEIKDLIKEGGHHDYLIPQDIIIMLGGAEEMGKEIWEKTPLIWVWARYLHDFRQTEAFRSRVRSSGMLAYWQKHGWPDLCRAAGEDDFVCD